MPSTKTRQLAELGYTVKLIENSLISIKPKPYGDLDAWVIAHKADILAELKAANDSGGALDTTHPTPLAWLATRGIYLEATGVWLQNISIQTNSKFPDDEAVAYISAHATEILSALVVIKSAELATAQQQNTT